MIRIAEKLLSLMKSPVGKYYRWNLSDEGEPVYMKVVRSEGSEC